MIDQLVALILDESKWLTGSIGLALLLAALQLYRNRNSDILVQQRVSPAMNLFFGVTIGTMAFGHLLAVTTKLAIGMLEGSLLKFYAIGIFLAVPSWWLISHSWTLAVPAAGRGRTTLILNGWVVLTLLAMGIPNIPLAATGLLNIVYHLQSRPVVRWVIVGVAVVVNVGLFIGSLVFLASGQSFEQFRGME